MCTYIHSWIGHCLEVSGQFTPTPLCCRIKSSLYHCRLGGFWTNMDAVNNRNTSAPLPPKSNLGCPVMKPWPYHTDWATPAPILWQGITNVIVKIFLCWVPDNRSRDRKFCGRKLNVLHRLYKSRTLNLVSRFVGPSVTYLHFYV